jgi:peptidoglycan/LPS O-acetylase OafA/YrhL
MTTSVNRKYLPEVDHLRFYAAFLVLVYHGQQIIGARLGASGWWQTTNPFAALISEGHTGVGMFIVLSGFILTVGCVGNSIDYRKFIVARALRIYPLYVVFVFVGAYSNPTASRGMGAFLQSLSPFTTLPGAMDISQFTVMAWAVGVEVLCYLVFPFLILFSNKIGTRFLVQVILAMCVFRAFAVSEGSQPHDVTYNTIVGRLDEFCLGMIAARIYVLRGLNQGISRVWILPAIAIVLGGILAYHLVGGHTSGAKWKVLWPVCEGTMWAVFILAYVSASPVLPSLVSQTAARLGEISYSAYLGHLMVINAVMQHGWMIQLTGNPRYDALLTTVVIVGPILVLISTLTFETFERPFLTLRPRYVRGAGLHNAQGG